MNRQGLRSLSECTTKEEAIQFLEILAIHTKDSILGGLVRTWKHLTLHEDVSHTVRDYGPIRATRLGLRERQVLGRIQERLTQAHASVGKIRLP